MTRMSECDSYKGASTCLDVVSSQVISLVRHNERGTLPSGNVWCPEQNNANNAYNVSFPSGAVNNNNKNNTYAVVSVAELYELQVLLFDAESRCWKNKRSRYDAARCHYNLTDIIHLSFSIQNNVYSPGTSICFIVSYPKYREVFAALYYDRVVHHLVSPFIIKVAEKVHRNNGDISHGNRIGFSALTAAKQLQSYMNKCPNGVCFTMDISGCFMNVDRQMAYDIFLNYYNEYGIDGYSEKQCELFLRIIKILLLHDPSKNCIRRSPISMWRFISKNKTLFKTDGKGFPIGNFYSQLIINLVLAIWSIEIKKLKLLLYITQFVDDSGFVGLLTLEEVRLVVSTSKEVLNNIGLTLHPKKFYIQPVHHGMYFCGRWIFPDRMYIGNRTVKACINTIKKYGKNVSINNARKVLSSFNSYVGFMCHGNNFNIQKQLVALCLELGFGKWLYFEKRKTKIVCVLNKRFVKRNIVNNELNDMLKFQINIENEIRNEHWSSNRT